MNMRWVTSGAARRQAVAGLVLLATVLACLWVGDYKEQALNTHAVGLTVPVYYRSTPSWGIPVAIAVGVIGAAIALLIYRPRGSRR